MTGQLFAAYWYVDEPKEGRVHWFYPTGPQPDHPHDVWAASLCLLTTRHNHPGWSGYHRTDKPVNCRTCLRLAAKRA